MTRRCFGTVACAGCSTTPRPPTLGSFLRAFTFGRFRQLDAASQLLIALADQTLLVGRVADGGFVLVDVDDTIIEVHGYAKRGAGLGYMRVRGLNALLATAATGVPRPRPRRGVALAQIGVVVSASRAASSFAAV
jgi:hypothetical protein